MENSLKHIINEINEKNQLLSQEMTAFETKGNKAAGRRARKLTLEIAALGKQFRKLSL